MAIQPVNFNEILVEILTDKPTYNDYVNALDNVFSAGVDFPINQLLRIRALRQTDDRNIALSTIRMLGFNISSDFFNLNPDLALIPYEFARYYENSYGKDFYKFISFILGREVIVTPLYTQDYNTFLETPLGVEQVDGGDWYLTTHVDLVVDITGFADNIISAPGKTFYDQVLQFFYDYAPIQLVVRKLLFSLTVRTTISFVGAFLTDRALLSIGGIGLSGGQNIDDALSVTLFGSDVIVEGNSAQYLVKIEWTPNYSEYYTNSNIICDNDICLVDIFGTVTASQINATTSVTLSTNYANRILTKTVTIIDAQASLFVQSISIEGPNTVDENSLQYYVVRVFWSNNTQTVTGSGSNLEWSSDSVDVAFNSANFGIASIRSVSANVQTTLRLQYTTSLGVIQHATKQVNILNVDTSKYLLYVLINGSPTINDKSTTQYTCTAVFSDGTTEVINPIWYFKSTVGSISMTGMLTVGTLIASVQASLSAEYTYRGYTSVANLTISILQNLRTIVSTEIIGSDTLVQMTVSKYVLAITWSDGQRSIVKAESWKSSRFTVDAFGNVNVGLVDGNSWLLLEAIVFQNGIEYRAEKLIHLLKKQVVLDFVSISGQKSIKATDSLQYVAYAHYSDGSRIQLTPSISLIWSIDSSFASISPTGVLSITGIPTSTLIQVSVRYTQDSIEYDAIHYVVPVVKQKIITQLVILGPNSVREHDVDTYYAQATYDDGSVVNVIPDWTVTSTELDFDPAETFVINREGVAKVRSVIRPTAIILQARFFSVIALLRVQIENYAYEGAEPPYSLTIVGPTTLTALGSYQYALSLKETASSDPRVVAGTWQSSIDPLIASVDDFGLLTVFARSNLPVTLIASYGCGYKELQKATLVITLPVPISSGAGTLNLIGPNFVYDNSANSYTAMVTVGTTVTDVTSNAATSWTLTNLEASGISLIHINNQGTLTVGNIDQDYTFTVNIETTLDGNVYIGSISVVASVFGPMYGFGPFGLNDSTSLLANITSLMSTKLSGGLMTINVPLHKYGYFMHPVEYGLATFTNTANAQAGGWDGVTWPLDSIGTVMGPIIVPISLGGSPIQKQFYVYRTDFSSLGVIQYRVDYEHQ